MSNLPTQNDDEMVAKVGGGLPPVYAQPHPDTYQGVIVDIINLGWSKPTNPKFKSTEQAQYVIQIDDRIKKEDVDAAYLTAGRTPDDKAYEVVGKKFTVRTARFNKNSLHEKSNTRKLIKSILNRDLTQEEQDAGFKLTSLLGLNVQVTLTKVTTQDGKTYININNIGPWPAKYGAQIEPEDYVRLKDRIAAKEAEAAAGQ